MPLNKETKPNNQPNNHLFREIKVYLINMFTQTHKKTYIYITSNMELHSFNNKQDKPLTNWTFFATEVQVMLIFMYDVLQGKKNYVMLHTLNSSGNIEMIEYPFMAITSRTTGVIASISQIDLFKNYSYSIEPSSTSEPQRPPTQILRNTDTKNANLNAFYLLYP